MNTTQPRYTPDAEFPFDYDERTKQRLRWLRQATAAIDYHRERDALAHKWPRETSEQRLAQFTEWKDY